MKRIVLYYGRDDDGFGNVREFWRSRRNAVAFWRFVGMQTWTAIRRGLVSLGELDILRTRMYTWPELRGILFVFDRRRRWVVGDGDDLLGYKFHLVDARELRFVVEPPPPVPEGA